MQTNKRKTPPDLLKKDKRKKARSEQKLEAKSGALVAPTRSGEGWSLPICSESCLPDAVYNGLMMCGFKASLQKLRSRSMPTLGNDRSASWIKVINLLKHLEYPFILTEVTKNFKVSGGPMLNLLCAPPGVYIVSLSIEVDGFINKYSVMLSTIKESGNSHGKIIDNSKLHPVYLEGKDKKDKGSAKKAWRKVFVQNPQITGCDSLIININSVYSLQPTHK
jgi:hypothetical protein